MQPKSQARQLEGLADSGGCTVAVSLASRRRSELQPGHYMLH